MTRSLTTGVDEILPGYDFSRARLNKYASRYAKGGVVITLDPNVAAVFHGASEANEALRALSGDIGHADRCHSEAHNGALQSTEGLALRNPHLRRVDGG